MRSVRPGSMCPSSAPIVRSNAVFGRTGVAASVYDRWSAVTTPPLKLTTDHSYLGAPERSSQPQGSVNLSFKSAAFRPPGHLGRAGFQHSDRGCRLEDRRRGTTAPVPTIIVGSCAVAVVRKSLGFSS